MPQSAGGQSGAGKQPPQPQGRFGGMPYDWRRPKAARIKARWWNPDDPRLFTPKTFGWGYAVNVYWLVHLVRYFRRRS